MKVVVHISQVSFKGSSVKVAVYIYLKSHLQGSSLKVAVYIYLKSHLGGSSVKVAGHISRESLRRKQFENFGVHISRFI